jgi:hypothetical protein
VIAPAVYLLGTLTTFFCAILLLRGYVRARSRLLLWSGLCFCGLTVSNGLLCIDLVIFPEVNLYSLRLGMAAVAMLILVFGLVWDSGDS